MSLASTPPPTGATAPPSPLDPNPRLLAVAVAEVVAFVALVDHGGFTAAARVLHLSQPGISSRVRRLERAVGVVLVDRSVRRLTLTPAGEAFLPHARALLDALATGWAATAGPRAAGAAGAHDRTAARPRSA